MKTNATTEPRRYAATGEQNILRLVRHEGDEAGPLFVNIKRKGKRFWSTLNTSDMKIAKARAAVFIGKVDGEKWEDVQKLRTRGGFASIPMLLQTYLAASTIKSAARNVNTVKFIVRRAGGNPEGSTEQINDELAHSLTVKMVKEAGDDTFKATRAKRSANSYLGAARAVFTPSMMIAYRKAKLCLPLTAIESFMKAPRARVREVQYVEPPPAIMTKVAAGYPALKAKDPGAYAWFLLGAFLGLRDGETRAARWDMVTVEPSGAGWLTLPAEVTKTNWGRAVEIPAPVLAELLSLRGQPILAAPTDKDYLVPAAFQTERIWGSLKRLNFWLRNWGFTRDLYSKAYYELRKYYGNERVWRTKDLYTTARAMGHGPLMLQRYYSSTSGRAPTVIPLPVVSDEAIRATVTALAPAPAPAPAPA